MKKSCCFIAVLFYFIIAQSLFAQVELPRLSQKASVTQIIGLTEVQISYSRPNVKGRTIWGELVPFGLVWRTGADEATNISFGDDVKLNGNSIRAGKYALFTIPGKDEWIVIINSVAKQWGAFNYDSTRDVIRFKVKPQSSEFHESLEYNFNDVTIQTATVNIAWENLKISFTIEADFDKRSYKNIQAALQEAKPDDWIVYAIAGNYAADHDLHLDEGLEWINKSISIKENYNNYYIKSRILFKQGKFDDALKSLNKSKELGKNDKEYNGFKQNIDKLEKELKSKLKLMND